MINPYRVGKTVLFQVTYDRDWHLFESIPFFFISVFGVRRLLYYISLLLDGIMRLLSETDSPNNFIRNVGCLWCDFFAVPHEILSLQVKDMDWSPPCAGGPYCDTFDLRGSVAESLD